jgi:hypothetical protein
VASWAITSAVTVGALAFVCDGALVSLRGRSPARAAFASAACAFALAVVVGFALSPVAALLEASSSRIARSRPWGRLLWPLPVAAVALVAAVVATDSFSLAQLEKSAGILVGFSIGVVLAAVVATWRARPLAVSVALALSFAALAADVGSRFEERVRHDLLAVLVACGVLAAVAPVRRRLRVAPLRALVAWAVVLVAAAATTFGVVDRAAPGWRAWSEDWGRFGPSLAHAGRAVTDLDGDGYSSLFWSGDCDDFDSTRNPRAHETGDGIDHNCNGAVPPTHPSDRELGLAPPVGDPALGADDIDLLVLVTVDCMRADALRPDVTPRLSALASRGVTMSRAYSVGAATLVSLAFVQRTDGTHDRTVAKRLADHGIESAFVFSYGFGANPRAGVFLDDFTTLHVPAAEKRFDAASVTDRGLEAISHSRGRMFLWLHYYDAHAPVEVVPTPSTPEVPGLPTPYVAGLAAIDHEVGRVVDALEADGRFGRTAIIVTADHGEAFGAHGIPNHALSAYEPLIHVPAILVAPGMAPQKLDALVTHRDLPATLLGAFGLADEARATERFGRSWLRLRAAPTAPLHDFVVSYSWLAKLGEKRLYPLAAITEPRRKLLEGFGNTLEELYDPVADPGELDDLAPSERDSVERLHRTLAVYRDADGYL